MKRLIGYLGVAGLMMASVACGGSKSAANTAATEGTEAAEGAATEVEAAATADIVDTAVGAGSFNTLVAAVKAAELVDLLKGDGPYTVFAPTDDAFAKLPEGTVDDLLKPENKEKLQAILKHHVVAGNVGSAEVVKMTSADTANGTSLTIEASDDGVMVGGAKVVKTDIACSNGVIHVIDTVMMPN